MIEQTMRVRRVGEYLYFMCMGCYTEHQVHIGVGGWTWNNDYEYPTIEPSILVNKGKMNPTRPVCHSFVTNGSIRFLDDCTHGLKSETKLLPDIS